MSLYCFFFFELFGTSLTFTMPIHLASRKKKIFSDVYDTAKAIAPSMNKKISKPNDLSVRFIVWETQIFCVKSINVDKAKPITIVTSSGTVKSG